MSDEIDDFEYSEEDMRKDIEDYYFSLEHEGNCPSDLQIVVPSNPGFDSKLITIKVCEKCEHLYHNRELGTHISDYFN